ncbi:secreted RxLR effector protein 78-like [Lathyrus oleraceus]|uniref:secreted RxLR effector protein 78-like n=1 Tax=Pisum sativum TaxID=3888 RepID=UPI0021D31360|nr:secreted RxLR effector protein 78-like [Pisum sativum]
MLASRLSAVIGNIISIKQTEFIPGRNILDGVLMVNKVLDLAKREKKICLVMKVNYKKPYDNMSLKYLRFLLIKMGFGKNWRSWMEACVFKSSMSVMVNGSATDDFKVERGLRQGDPLFPFLFVIAMEGLTGLVDTTMEQKEFKGFKINDKEYVDILQFVADTIILCDRGSGHL